MNINFKRITDNDIPFLRAYLNKNDSYSCDNTIGVLYLWDNEFHYEYAEYKDYLIIRVKINNDYKYYYPIGENPNLVIKELKINSFFSLDEKDMKKMQEDFEIETEYLRDYSDYCYDAYSLAYLSGKVNSKHRNHVNKFERLYPNYEFVQYNKDDYEDVELFLNKYHKKGNSSEESNFELNENKKIITKIEKLNQLAYLLKVNNEVIGLTVGEIKKDYLIIHIEKALTEYDGSFAIINQLFAKLCYEKYNIKFINREDDAGEEGLRISKTNYHPLYLLNKYNVRIIKEK